MKDLITSRALVAVSFKDWRIGAVFLADDHHIFFSDTLDVNNVAQGWSALDFWKQNITPCKGFATCDVAGLVRFCTETGVIIPRYDWLDVRSVNLVSLGVIEGSLIMDVADSSLSIEETLEAHKSFALRTDERYRKMRRRFRDPKDDDFSLEQS